MAEQPPEWEVPRHLRVRIDITPDQAEALLGLLQDDDEFRAELAANPGEVLAEHGIVIEEGLPETIKLPPKEALSRLVSEAREQRLLEIGPSIPHVFALLWWVIGAMPLVPRNP
jgi:putative modified peptide